MRAFSLVILLFTALSLRGQVPNRQVFSQWLDGLEIGGSTQEMRVLADGQECRTHEWMVLSRLGQELRQDVEQSARKGPDGGLTFTWRLQLSAEPFQGRARWSPQDPGVLTLEPDRGPALRKEVPATTLLWPEAFDSRMKEAAKRRLPIQAVTFSFPFQQWNRLDLVPQGPAPLPGFPDAVRFTGEEREGPLTAPVEVWISPEQGWLRHRTELGGQELITQRAELPPPTKGKTSGAGFFERTLQPLPPDPFRLWRQDVTLRVEGGPLPPLVADGQQQRLPDGAWRLRQATPPTTAEATQPPVSGPPGAGEAPYLAPSPLVPFRDPAFEGLLRRMALPPGLSRWDLTRRVTSFVFDWITEKDFSVGFASALEVCHHPRGDCTEHGVLAVALLRRLGVPARGVTGWVGLGDWLGLHFWVEVRLGNRWVPVDPTFDQAPASAFRIKLGDTDLADMGSVAWEGAASDLARARWLPTGIPPLLVQGDQVVVPGGLRLRLPGASWKETAGTLNLRSRTGGSWRIQASVRPGEDQTRSAQKLAGPRTLRTGWWQAGSRRLWMDLGQGHWLQVEDISEVEAYALLDQLLAPTSSS